MSTQTELNRADPNRLADLLRSVNIGDALARLASDALVEETVAVSSNSGTLSSKALVIFGVYQAAGTVTGASTPNTPTGTLATKQYSLATDRKTLSFLAGDAVSSAKVLYLKIPANLDTALAALFQGQ